MAAQPFVQLIGRAQVGWSCFGQYRAMGVNGFCRSLLNRQVLRIGGSMENGPCRIQNRVYQCLEPRGEGGRCAGVVGGVLALLIMANIFAFALETVPQYARVYGGAFRLLSDFSILVFTVEYLARVWVAPQHPEGLYLHQIRGRIKFMFSPLMLIDLAAILPYFLAVMVEPDLRFLKLFRLLWILKVARYLPAMGMLGQVLKRERRILAAVMAIMLIMLFIASSLVFVLEHDRQPEKFATLFHAIWWGVATLTTVGYGDVVPISALGRALGVVIMMLGIGTFALPAGILASAFAEERKRRDFMLTWNLVARVPWFGSLEAREIADIAALLHPREVLAGEVVFHKGEEADSMFFIISGTLEAEFPDGPVRLGPGDYFGEVALIYHRPRTATVLALSQAKLLELDAKDLHRMFETRPRLRKHIVQQARERLARDQQGNGPAQ